MLLGLSITILGWLTSTPALAQTAGPIEEEVHVTATVPVNDAPTTPILISPENNSYLTTNPPDFVWRGSTDSHGIGKYQLWLDGQLEFDDIPAATTETSEFILTYDSTNNRFTLEPKVALTEGTHTWKIRVEDTLGNGTDSATWTFTIDTQAPNFVLTQIGEVTVAISAQDLSTVPTEPIVITTNEPQLLGTGERNSTVALTVTIPGDPTQNYTDTIDVNGNWGHLLGILPREVIIRLDFVITDLSGNISVLSNVPFIIRQETIEIPGPTPTPTPGASGGPEASPPGSPGPSPAIIIPVLPPKEIIHEIIQEATELIPSPIVAIVTALPPELTQPIIETLQRSAPFSAVMVVTAIPALTLIGLIAQFGQFFSPQLFLRLLQALGLVPAGKRQGWVYDTDSHKGVPFVLITVTAVDDNERQLPLIETVVTDVDGYYRSLQLPTGRYQLDVRHQDYRFPTAQRRPTYLTVEDFYRGEVFAIGDSVVSALEEGIIQERMLPSFLIPIDPRETAGDVRQRLRQSSQLFFARLSRWSSFLALPMFLISGILTLLFPSLWNWLVFILYAIIVGYKAVHWFKIPTITGLVTDERGVPLVGALVRLSEPSTNEVVAVANTSSNGQFVLYVPKRIYQVSIIKPGYQWIDQAAVTSLYELDAREKPQHLTVVMADLFARAQAAQSEIEAASESSPLAEQPPEQPPEQTQE